MPNPDDRILGYLNGLATCLCTELAALDGAPPRCLCGIIPGSFPGQSYGGVGVDMAWVRLANYFGSNTAGAQLQLTYDRVLGRTLVIEIGVVRCFKVPRGGVFDEVSLADMTTRQMRDLGAIERAIACCSSATWNGHDFVVGNYVPIGPEGDVFGGLFQIALQMS